MSTREDFEKWAEGSGFDLSLFSDSDCYRNDDTALSWRAWQAATRVEREACAKVCESRRTGGNIREDIEAKRCAAAIRARGDQS